MADKYLIYHFNGMRSLDIDFQDIIHILVYYKKIQNRKQSGCWETAPIGTGLDWNFSRTFFTCAARHLTLLGVP